ncbi:MAG TPA: hypothetical protein VE262_20370 [Blastocatellia bacterium]|nr:hypothetical protein [Blastocatellia bacterium]
MLDLQSSIVPFLSTSSGASFRFDVSDPLQSSMVPSLETSPPERQPGPDALDAPIPSPVESLATLSGAVELDGEFFVSI